MKILNRILRWCYDRSDNSIKLVKSTTIFVSDSEALLYDTEPRYKNLGYTEHELKEVPKLLNILYGVE